MFLTSLLNGLSTEYWENLIQSFEKVVDIKKYNKIFDYINTYLKLLFNITLLKSYYLRIFKTTQC